MKSKNQVDPDYADFALSDNPKDEIEIIDYTDGGGKPFVWATRSLRNGNSELLSLKSTKFTVSINDENKICFLTKGSGHGVGMSQWGANYLAMNGGTYIEILEHYYNGIIVKKYR